MLRAAPPPASWPTGPPGLPPIATTSAIEAATALTLRRPLDIDVLASRPVAPSRRRGRESRPAGTASTVGPSSATPIASTMAVGTTITVNGRPSASESAVAATATIPRPSRLRAIPRRSRPSDSSRSASPARTRPARNAAAITALSARTSPIEKATAIGTSPASGRSPSGAIPRSTSIEAIGRAARTPATQPTTPAKMATTKASAAIIRRTWPGLAPTARKRASSRRRWAIISPKMPATTKTVTAPPLLVSIAITTIVVSR